MNFEITKPKINFKKIFCGMLAFVLAFACLQPSFTTIAAYAEANSYSYGDNVTSGNVGGIRLSLSYDGTYYSVTGCDQSVSGDIVIPDTYNGLPVKVLESFAFEYCWDITSVTIGGNVTSIEYSAFYECSSLTSVTIGAGVENISSCPFLNCYGIVSIDVDSANPNYTSVDGVLFNKDKTTLVHYPAGKTSTSYVIPDGVTCIGYEAFRGCTNLTSVTIPASVTEMDGSPFNWNTLVSISVASANPNYTSVDGVLFNKDKTTLIQYPAGKTATAYVIPDGVTCIGQSAFSDCQSLTSVRIPDSVTAIDYCAFNGCSNLTSIVIPDSVTNIDDYAFDWSGYYNDDSNWENGVLYIGNHLIDAQYDISGSYEVKNGTKTIADGAFEYCYYITSVAIPDSVTSIGYSAFAYCEELVSVSIGSGVVNAESWIFSECENLTDITIADGVTCIDKYAVCDTGYYNNSENWENDSLYIGNVLIAVDEDASGLLEIKNGTTAIADECLDSYDITSVMIPDSVTNIGEYVFEIWGLNTVYYGGAQSDWEKIKIGDYNSSLFDATIHYGVNDVESHWVKNEEESSCTQNVYYCSCGYERTTAGEGHNFNGGTCSVCGSSMLTFELNEDFVSYYVNGCAEGVDGEIIIPETYQGLPVTGIGEYAFSWCDGITSVVIGGNVTSIGYEAFYGCSNLETVTISAGVTSIGEEAFDYCYNLKAINVDSANPDYTSVDGVLFNKDKTKLLQYPCGKEAESYIIPDSVTDIGNGAFYKCDNLASVEISGNVTNIGERAFYYCNGLTSIVIPDSVAVIGSEAFCDCSNLTSVIIGNGVTSIRDGAFEYCSSLSSVTIGNKVTEIGAYAFQNCRDLASIELPDSVTNIEYGAFSSCTSLTCVTIPAGVTSIGSSAFNYCYNLNAINVDSANTCYASVDGVLFNKDKTILIQYPCGKKGTEYTIPDSVTNIGDSAFYGCENIKSIIIPDNVLSISEYAFYGCTGLTSVSIGNGVTSIGDYAFGYCYNLSSITISDSVTSIGAHAFSYCTSLTSVEIPDSVTHIGYGAFSSCSGLTSVTIGNGVTNIGEYTFDGCTSLASIVIPDSVTCIGYSNFYNTGYYNDDSNWENGVLYIGNHLIKARKKLLSGEYEIKDGTKTIADDAFYNCDSLTSVIIPDSVTRIGSDAFRDCDSLTSITIPDSVTDIGRRAFNDCSGLVEAYIGSGVKDGYGMFSDCISLKKVTFAEGFDGSFDYAFDGCEKLEEVNMPNSVTELSYCEFQGCSSLDDIDVPTTLVKIEPHALDNTGWYEAQQSGDLYFKNVLYGYKDSNGYNNLPENYTLNIKAGTKGIAEAAFAGKVNLVNTVLPDSMQYIGDGAFRGCVNLMSVTVPASVTYIGSEALGYMNSWDKITDFTIYGERGTTAEEYADKNGITFLESRCNHVAGDWIIDVAATCTTAGSKHTACTICGEVLETEAIAAKGHTVVKDKAVAPTCTDEGKTEGSHCSVCSVVIIAQQTVPATGHKEVTDAAVQATCTTEGKTEGSHCSVCNAVIVAQTTVEATGHTESDWIIDKKATVNRAGSKHKECTECGEELKTVKIKQLKCNKPKLKKVANTATGVKITWSKVSGTDSYEIYRKTGSGSWKKIATVKRSVASYTDKTVKSGTTYKYTVKARNEAGLSKYDTKGLSIKCLADPTLKTPTSAKKGITLKWSKVTGAQGYIIYRKTGNGSYSKLTTVKGVSNLSYVDKSAKKNKKYTYKVKAYYGKTYSAFSNTKTIKDKY